MILVRRVFLRVLAAVYLAAFFSLGVQVRGLIGARGILPAAEYLRWVALQVPGLERFRLLPTLFWIDASDAALVGACMLGCLLAVAVLLDVAPAAMLFLMWALYLSLACVGQIFLSYQWDALLLETGLLAVLLAPPGLRVRGCAQAEPSPVAVWLLRWLLFRLMFGSGWVKLASGDPSWRGLTALRVHYETQPLPTWIGYWAHQLPGWFHGASATALFAIELGAPFLIFGPRRARQGACAACVSLQAIIFLTGNYGYFNLLAAALALLLLDDRALLRLARRAPAPEPTVGPVAPAWPRAVLVPAAVVLGVASAGAMLATLGGRGSWPAPLGWVDDVVAPFRSVSSYGLFAVMTTTRPEIVVEGSRDGVTWRPYAFRWKPGDVRIRPRFVAPHQPRLDWQMWFAALGRCADNVWFLRFVARLKEGEPAVLGLLAVNPFPDAPPAFIRAELHDYRFTDPDTLRRTGAWWRRVPNGLYCNDFELN